MFLFLGRGKPVSHHPGWLSAWGGAVGVQDPALSRAPPSTGTMVATGRGAAGPRSDPVPAPVRLLGEEAWEQTAAASQVALRPRVPCQPVRLFGAVSSLSQARCQPWHLTRLLARLFEMNNRMVPMETHPSRRIGVARALHSLFRLQQNIFSTTV